MEIDAKSCLIGMPGWDVWLTEMEMPHRKICMGDTSVGIGVNSKSPTNIFKILHSKERTHIVPIQEGGSSMISNLIDFWGKKVRITDAEGNIVVGIAKSYSNKSDNDEGENIIVYTKDDFFMFFAHDDIKIEVLD